MMLRILLLVQLTSCLCGGFVVDVTQSSYQAQENQDITLDWTFTTKTDRPLTSISVLCEQLTDHNTLTVFHLHEGVEVPESQDGQFAGRVQCDKDVLREGRLRLHVSRLRTEDSGKYLCDVNTNDGVDFNTCRLNVSAAADEPEPPRPTKRPEPQRPTEGPGLQRPTERPEPESRGRMGLYVGLSAVLLVVCVGLFVFRLNNKGQSLQLCVRNHPSGPTGGSGGPPFCQEELLELHDLNHETRSGLQDSPVFGPGVT